MSPPYDEWGDPVHICTATLSRPCHVCGIKVVLVDNVEQDDDDSW